MAGLDGRGAVGPKRRPDLYGRASRMQPGRSSCRATGLGPPEDGRPSAAIVAATSASGLAPTSTVTTGSSGLGSSSASNWLRSNEAGMYS